MSVFGPCYLRRPNEEDITRLLHVGELRRFPGMLGSIDCMHWQWKNCSSAWQGQFRGYAHDPTIILECVASYDLWIWHAFFGLPGSFNDINALHRSPIFDDLAEGRAPPANYSVNGRNYTMGYYLADGIYPRWVTFVKTLRYTHSNRQKYFKLRQEAVKKDVERAFGVLQARFAIVAGLARYFSMETLSDIMKTCVILHNMIIEDERHLQLNAEAYSYDWIPNSPTPPTLSREARVDLSTFIQNHRNIRDKNVHDQLQEDLIEHQWMKYREMKG